MGSSNKDYAGNRPAQAAPVAGMTPTPVAQPAPPINFPSFLPNDPTAMASGITPEMVASINNMNTPAAAPPAAGGGAAAASAAIGGPGAQDTYVPPEVKAAGPDAEQAYISAKASGNDALAARIQLSAKLMGGNPNNPATFGGRGGGAGYTTSGSGMRSSAGGVPSGAGPGLY
jgi:hypothetical protein